jgi:hypothetical protein
MRLETKCKVTDYATPGYYECHHFLLISGSGDLVGIVTIRGIDTTTEIRWFRISVRGAYGVLFISLLVVFVW